MPVRTGMLRRTVCAPITFRRPRDHAPEVQDIHRLVQCPAAPDTMWVQHHNGVFRSTDAARSWQEVTTIRPAKFGFAVAVHPARS